MARIDSSSPVTRQQTSAAEPTERTTASAGESYQVVSGDTLSKLAKEAYGDASKWTLIRDANAGKVKMRGDIPIIQIGAELKIPPAPEGWGARGAAPQRRAPAAQPEAAAETAQTQKTEGPPNPAHVYANAKKSLDSLEFQLKGVSAPLREQLFESLAEGEPPSSPQLKGVAEHAVKTMTDLREQMAQLPADQRANVEKLLDQDQAQWPLSGRAIEALSGAVQSEATREAAAPKTSDAVEKAARDGMLEVRELGTVVRSMAEDMQAGKTEQQVNATGEAAMQQLQKLMASTAIPPEQAPAFAQAMGALQELAARGGTPEQVAALGRQLEQLPPMRGTGLQGVPQTQLTPSLQRAVTSTIQDGTMNMREFAGVLRALSSDVQRSTRDEASAQQVYQEASALMMHLTQNAKIQPGQEQAFVAAANEFGRLTQSGQAQPKDLERLALAIEQGRFGQ